jgi:ribosomal protein S18 acetylase RimI-like enzyme
MAALLEQARAAGHRTVSLSVSPDSPALRLYQQLGFVTVGQVGGSLTMLKELSKGR